MWEVSWLGVAAGEATSELEAHEGGWRATARARSATWLARLYPIDDRVVSTWGGVGRAVDAWWREGGFQQDRFVVFDAHGIAVRGRQLRKGAWEPLERRFDPVADIEDPVSAFYALRERIDAVGDVWAFPLWSGHRVVRAEARAVAREELGGAPALRVVVAANGGGGTDLDDALVVWLSDDARRVPLAAEIRTRAGLVRVTLRAS